jgi:cyanate lyase
VVKSKPTWKLYEKESPTRETVNFAIPANPTIRRFDEVKIVYRVDAFRADDGAKIAIDRFVLVPQGL